jgi:hypothetical protein
VKEEFNFGCCIFGGNHSHLLRKEFCCEKKKILASCSKQKGVVFCLQFGAFPFSLIVAMTYELDLSSSAASLASSLVYTKHRLPIKIHRPKMGFHNNVPNSYKYGALC